MPLGMPYAAMTTPTQLQQPMPGGLGGFFRKAGNVLFPEVPGVQVPGMGGAGGMGGGMGRPGGVDPMLLMGLDLLRRGSQGERLGSALAGSYMTARQDQAGAMQNAFQMALLKKRMEREDTREERESAKFERETRGMDATELSQYLESAPQTGVPEWMARGIRDPMMREKFDRFNLTPLIEAAIATPDPADDLAAYQQAQAVASAATPIAGMPAELRTFDEMTEGLTPEQQRQAREVALGIRSRAGTNRVTDVNGIPTLTGTMADGRPFAVPLTTAEAERSGETGMSAATQLGKLGIERFDKQYEAALSASSSLRAIEEGARLLDEGIRTGTAAGGRNTIARAFDTVLGRQTDDSALTANTDAYLANAGQLVAERIKAFGAGTGLSDADRAFAERMAGGDVAMTEGALRRILEINYKAAKGKIDRYNSRYEKLSGQYGDIAAIYDRFDVPAFEEIAPWTQAAPAPQGPPQPGQVVDGYAFTGGDPANPNNWRQQ